MITGIRGRVFISYRWSGSAFRSVAATLAHGLVRRGYEAVFDAWYVDESVEDPVVRIMQELAASTVFLAAISPDYLSVLKGIVEENEFGEKHSHEVNNDGWVRDELNHVLMCKDAYHGVGVCFGCSLRSAPDFPFPTFEVANNAEVSALLDEQFGPELELPTRVRPEIKHLGKWIELPEMPLFLAYRLVRQSLAALSSRPSDYFLSPGNLPMWSRLDRSHLIWEARATCDAAGSEFERAIVLSCPNCTAQYQDDAQATQCPRCRRASLERRVAGKVEALVVMRPVSTRTD
jgi:hypothetical protein